MRELGVLYVLVMPMSAKYIRALTLGQVKGPSCPRPRRAVQCELSGRILYTISRPFACRLVAAALSPRRNDGFMA